MFSEEIIKNVAPYLMQFDDDLAEQMFRLRWVSIDILKIMNKEGVEKLIDVNS